MEKQTGRIREFLSALAREIGPEDRVTAAVSGGCDSVCLLFLLTKLREQTGFRLRAMHENHGIRGREADGDEAFVRELCSRWNVPLTVFRDDIPAACAASGESTEEAARRIRYANLKALAEEEKAALPEGSPGRVLVCTAHHRDDQAETVLLALLRGTGLTGLCGMRARQPFAGGCFLWRPLLDRSREDLRALAREAGLSWREDATNAETDASRNFVRHVLLPQAQERFPGAARRIAALAGRLSETDRFLEEEARRRLDECRTPEGGLSVSTLLPLPQELRFRVLRAWLTEGGGAKDVGQVHYSALEGLLAAQSGSRLSLPGGRTVLRTQTDLRPEAAPAESALPSWQAEVFPYENGRLFPENPYTKTFDYDKINGLIECRTRRTGDWFRMKGGGTKTVQRYMIERKIPVSERDSVPLFAAGSHVFWIVGWRVCADTVITEQTKRVLRITVKETT